MSDLSEYISAPQRSDAWHAERRGKITASRVSCILPGKRGGYLAARQSYLYGLAAERVGVVLPSPYVSAAMERGIALEPLAREALAFELGATIAECGFIADNACGASPDGIATMPDGSSAYVELKCPEAVAFVAFAMGADVDPEYMAQVQMGMMVTGLHVAYLAYYHPEFPRPLICRRIERDTEYCARLKTEIEKANAEINNIVEKLK